MRAIPVFDPASPGGRAISELFLVVLIICGVILAMGTGLVPAIGYDQAVQIVKAAAASGRTVREVALEQSGLDQTTLDRLLNPGRQARPAE